MVWIIGGREVGGKCGRQGYGGLSVLCVRDSAQLPLRVPALRDASHVAPSPPGPLSRQMGMANGDCQQQQSLRPPPFAWARGSTSWEQNCLLLELIKPRDLAWQCSRCTKCASQCRMVGVAFDQEREWSRLR